MTAHYVAPEQGGAARAGGLPRTSPAGVLLWVPIAAAIIFYLSRTELSIPAQVTVRALAISIALLGALGQIKPMAASMAATFLFLPPSLTGEHSSLVATTILGALIGGLLIEGLLLKATRRPVLSTVPLFGLVAGFWLLGHTENHLKVSLLWLVVGGAVLAVDATRSAASVLRLLCAVISILSCSYWISLLAGFQDGSNLAHYSGADLGRPQFSYYLWNPITITGGGYRLLGVGPREVGLAGEPGLWAALCALATVGALLSYSRPSRLRLTVAGLCASGVVASQSAAVLLVLPLALVAALQLRTMITRRNSIARTMSALLICAFALLAAGRLFTDKANTDAMSLSDRGLGEGSQGNFAAGSRISLLATLHTDGLTVIFPLLALVLLCWLARHNTAALTTALLLLIIGITGQPLIYHPILIAVSCLIVRLASDGQLLITAVTATTARSKD